MMEQEVGLLVFGHWRPEGNIRVEEAAVTALGACGLYQAVR